MSKELWVAGTGLIGSEVIKLARSKDIEVAVTAKSEVENPTGEAELVDITDYEAVKEYLWKHNLKQKTIKKAVVAAGLALPVAAKRNPELAYLVNAIGPRNIGKAILTLPEANRPSVVFMGSALQYEEREGAISEDVPFVKVGDPYVESKSRMVDFIRELVEQGLDAKIAMIFNSTGPIQSTDYFLPAMADQAAKISLGLQEPVIRSRYVGHIRDFSHVKDTAKGIFLSLRGKSGDLINISSGHGIKLEDMIYTLMEMAEVDRITHEVDPQFNKPPKVHATWGDNSRLRSLAFVSEKTMIDICRDLFEERLRVNRG